MRKKVLLLSSVVTVLLMAGCSEPDMQQDKAERQDAPKKEQSAPEQEKTVVVNEGMSKKEEEKLNERLAELEDKVEQKNVRPEATEPEDESAEDQVLEAAEDYYAAAAAGNYTYTYDALTFYDRGRFTEEEWVAANTSLGSDEASYDIYSTELVDDTTATVALTITATDGFTEDRTTLFVYEDGEWKHELTQREYDLFAGATATATATASANGSPNSSPNRNAPNPRASEDCISEGGTPVPPGTDGDGDGDGCAGEGS